MFAVSNEVCDGPAPGICATAGHHARCGGEGWGVPSVQVLGRSTQIPLAMMKSQLSFVGVFSAAVAKNRWG